MNSCKEIALLLDDHADGVLDDLRARAVRAHLRTCASCTAQVEATTKLVESATVLRDVDPPPELWDRISQELDSDDVRLSARPRLWWWWQAWSRRLAFTGAAMAVAALALFVLAQRGRRPIGDALAAIKLPVSPQALYDDAVREVVRAETEYQTAVADLREIARQERDRWDPKVRQAFDENLATIDAAIARQTDVARSHPGDVAVADALGESYRKEIEFLQEAVVRGEAR